MSRKKIHLVLLLVFRYYKTNQTADLANNLDEKTLKMINDGSDEHIREKYRSDTLTFARERQLLHMDFA